MEAKPRVSQRARGKRAELLAWIEAVRPGVIGLNEWERLRLELAPISDSYLRKLLRESGVPLEAVVEGVRQESFDSLEASLLRLLDEYETGDRKAVRRVVIEGKEHARFAARAEMVLWMVTWLENPPLFRQWVGLRRKTLLAADEHG